MGNKYAREEFRKNAGSYAREIFITSKITTTTTIQGGANGVWNISAAAGSYDVTVANFDKTHFSDYVTPPNKPYIIIKCSVDTSANNVAIKNAAGSTLYTFAADYSVNPRYVVLVLSAPTTGSFAWALA